MPHDMKGKLVKEGDVVLIRARVKSVTPAEEYCNATLVTEQPMPPYIEGTQLVLNTKQVEVVES